MTIPIYGTPVVDEDERKNDAGTEIPIFGTPVEQVSDEIPIFGTPVEDQQEDSRSRQVPFTDLTATAMAGRPVPGTLLGDMNRDGRLNLGEGIMAVGRQFAYGVKGDLPRMLGDAMKYVSDPGEWFYDQGKRITDWVDQQERDDPGMLEKYEWSKNPFMHVLGGGARMIPQSLGPPLLLAGVAAMLPEAAIAALGGTAVVGAAAALAGAVPAGLSQGQQTYEKLLEAGVDDETAAASSRLTGLIEWGGESVANMLGVAKWPMRMLGIGAKGTKIGTKVAGKEATEYLAKLAMPKTWKTIAGKTINDLARTMAEEVGTEVGQAVGQTYVENVALRDIGQPTSGLLDAAKEVIGPTIGMTLLMGPLGARAQIKDVRQQEAIKKALTDPKVHPEYRAAAALALTKDLYDIDKTAGENFSINASTAVTLGLPLPLSEVAVSDPDAKGGYNQLAHALYQRGSKRSASIIERLFMQDQAGMEKAKAPPSPAPAIKKGQTPKEKDAIPPAAAPAPAEAATEPPVMFQAARQPAYGEQQGRQLIVKSLDEPTFDRMLKPLLATTSLMFQTYRKLFPNHTHIAMTRLPNEQWQVSGVGSKEYLLKRPAEHTRIFKQVQNFDTTEAQAHSLTDVKGDELAPEPIRFEGTQAGLLQLITGLTPKETPAAYEDADSTYIVPLKPERVSFGKGQGAVTIGRLIMPAKRAKPGEKAIIERLFAWDTDRWHRLPSVKDRKSSGAELLEAAKRFVSSENGIHINAVTKKAVEDQRAIEAEADKVGVTLKLGKGDMPTGTFNKKKTIGINPHVNKTEKKEPWYILLNRWREALPWFQGNKREMSVPVTKAARDPESGWTGDNEIQNITEIYEPFGGGGSWGLFLATTIFKFANKITIGELNPARLEMIRYIHQHGNQFFEDVYSKKGANGLTVKQILDMAWKSGTIASGGGLQGQLAKVIKAGVVDKINKLDANQLMMLQIVHDLVSRGSMSPDMTLGRVVANVTGLYNMARQFRAINGENSIVYVSGDAYARDVPQGKHVLTLLDPPYVFTQGYGEDMVPVETYEKTGDLIERAVAAGNNIIYTDSVWWKYDKQPTFKDLSGKHKELAIAEWKEAQDKKKQVLKTDRARALATLKRIQAALHKLQPIDLTIGGHRYEVLGMHNAMLADRKGVKRTPQKRLSPTELIARNDAIIAALPFKVGQKVNVLSRTKWHPYDVTAIRVDDDGTVRVHVSRMEIKRGVWRNAAKVVTPDQIKLTPQQASAVARKERASATKNLTPKEKKDVNADAKVFDKVVSESDYYDFDGVENQAKTRLQAIDGAWHDMAMEMDPDGEIKLAGMPIKIAYMDEARSKSELLPLLAKFVAAHPERFSTPAEKIPARKSKLPPMTEDEAVSMSKRQPVDERQQELALPPAPPTTTQSAEDAEGPRPTSIREGEPGVSLEPTTEGPGAGMDPDKAALYNDNVRLADTIASDHVRTDVPGLSWDEVSREARSKLAEAATRYDPRMGEFRFYAGTAIRRHLRSYRNQQTTRKKTDVSLSQAPTQADEEGEASETLTDRVRDRGLSPARAAELNQAVADMTAAVATLSKSDRAIIEALIEGKTQRQIALDIGTSPANVSQRLTNILKRIRAAMEAKGYNAADIADILNPQVDVADQVSLSKKNRQVFYSGLARAVDVMNLKQAIPGDQMLNKVMGLQGAKKQEIEESGLADWLMMQKENGATVTKADALAFLSENGVRVEEVNKRVSRTRPLEEWSDTELRTAFDNLTGESAAEQWTREELISEVAEAQNEYQETGLPEDDVNDTKFSQYAPPGGVPGTYREVLLTVPSKLEPTTDNFELRRRRIEDDGTGDYYSPHWSELNVIAHMLLDERRIPLDVLAKTNPELAAKLRAEGKTDARALHMIEGQSDLHQAGAAKGYAGQVAPVVEAVRNDADTMTVWKVTAGTQDFGFFQSESEANRVAGEIRAGKRIIPGQVPALPFRGDAWKRLIVRKMLAEAVDGGYDLLVWSTGEDRFKKWGSQRVDWKRIVSEKEQQWEVSAAEQTGGEHAGQNIEALARERGVLLEQNGKTVRTKEDLRLVIEGIKRGDETNVDKLTDRIWDRMQAEPEGTSLPRKEFFEFLYDTSFRNEASKIVRQMDKGAGVGRVQIFAGPKLQQIDIQNLPEAAVQKAMTQVHAIPITDTIRDAVAKGQPLYSKKAKQGGRITKAQVEARVSNWISKQAHVPTVRVIDTIDDAVALGLSGESLRMLRDEKPRGFYDRKNDQIVIVADQLITQDEAMEVILHEAVGHFGVEGLFGNDAIFRKAMLALAAEVPAAELQKIADLYAGALPDKGLPEALSSERNIIFCMTEYIAQRAETEQTLWDRFVEIVRKALLRILPTTVVNRMMKRGLIDNLIQSSRDYVREGPRETNVEKLAKRAAEVQKQRGQPAPAAAAPRATREGVAMSPDDSERLRRFESWKRGARPEIVVGWRAENAPEQKTAITSETGTEGIGLYIARDKSLAGFFNKGKIRNVYFPQPQNPMVVNNEPLHILHETEDIMQPPNPADSPWTAANKEAARRVRLTNQNWGKKQGELQRALTDVMLERGHDAVVVKSGLDQWVVILARPEEHIRMSIADVSKMRDVTPEKPDLVRTVDTQTARDGDEIRGIGVVENGEIRTFHVTRDPDKVLASIKNATTLLELGNSFDDLGPGLYTSDAPIFWKGRDFSRWDWIKSLTDEQRQSIADEVGKQVLRQRQTHYITESEYDTANRLISNFVDSKNNESIAMLADQPWNVQMTEPEFLARHNIQPTARGETIEIGLRGKFGELKHARMTLPETKWMLEAGYSGAFVPSGFASYPQAVIFDRNAVVKAIRASGEEVRMSKSVTPQQDAAYMAAVEKGDTEAAQRMVDEAAKRAGWKKVFHGTNAEAFTQFGKMREGRFGKAVYTATSRKRAEGYGQQVMELYASPEALVYGPERDAIVYSHNRKIFKSADAITRDDAGNVIPLSQRFNEESPDIRMSKKPTQMEVRRDKRGYYVANVDNPELWERARRFAKRSDAVDAMKFLQDEYARALPQTPAPESTDQTMQGEWWIDDGSAQYADGDIGDLNHEGAVREKLMYEAAELLGVNESEIAVIDEWADENKDALIKAGMAEEKVDILRGYGDAREYAMKTDGAVRLVNNDAETWDISPEQMKAIARGIGDAYQDQAEGQTFNIEVSKTGRYYRDVPLEVLERGDMAELARYDSRSNYASMSKRTPRGEGAEPQRIPANPIKIDEVTRERFFRYQLTYKPTHIPKSTMEAQVRPALERKIAEEGVIKLLVDYDVKGFPDGDRGVITAQLLLNTPEYAKLFSNLDDKAAMTAATSIAARYGELGTRTGRALAYRRDDLQKPADRQLAILRLMAMPEERFFKNWSMLTDAQREEAHNKVRKNMADAVKALRKIGVKNFTNVDSTILMNDQKFAQIINTVSEQYVGPGEKIYEYWRNSILSGLHTNIVNVTSNWLHSTWELFVQKPAEALVNMFVQDPNAPTFQSLAAAYRMLWPHITDANRAMVSSYVTETGMFTAIDTKGQTAIGGKWGRFVRTPQRALLAMDEWYKTLLTYSLAYDYATRAADKNRLTGIDRQTFIEWAATTTNGDSVCYEDAHKEAVRILFQEKPGAIGTSLLSARNAPGLTGWVMKFVVPFVTTPANLIKIGVKKSPFGLISMGMNGIAALTSPDSARYRGPDGKARLITDSVEQVIAWSLGALLYTLTAGDDDDDWPWITGSLAGTPNEKRFQQRNIPPHSIRIGDRWYSYARLEPFSTSMSLFVDAMNTWRAARAGKPMSKYDAAKILSLIRDRTYLQSVGDIIRGIEDPEQWVYMSQNFGSSWMPNIARQALRATDPLQRDNRVRERGAAWLGKSLFLRGAQSALPIPDLQTIPRFDHWGRPISKDVDMQLLGQPLSDIAWRMMVPVKVQKATSRDNVDRMIWNWNRINDDPGKAWWPGNTRPEVTFRGHKIAMTDAQYAAYQMRRGDIAMRMAKRIRWNFDNPDVRHITTIQKVFERAGSIARQSMMREIVVADIARRREAAKKSKK